MPVALYPGMRICSFTFEELKSPTTKPYTTKKGVKYAFQKGPDASRLDKESK
jgi:dCTP deaminase